MSFHSTYLLVFLALFTVVLKKNSSSVRLKKKFAQQLWLSLKLNFKKVCYFRVSDSFESKHMTRFCEQNIPHSSRVWLWSAVTEHALPASSSRWIYMSFQREAQGQFITWQENKLDQWPSAHRTVTGSTVSSCSQAGSRTEETVLGQTTAQPSLSPHCRSRTEDFKPELFEFNIISITQPHFFFLFLHD